MRQGCSPILDGPIPFFGDEQHCQIHQPENGILIWENGLYFNHLAQGAIDRLNGIGRVDDPANLHRVVEYRNYVLSTLKNGGSLSQSI